MEPAQAVSKLLEWLCRNGLKVTSQRKLITEVFFDPQYREDHPTVEELYLNVRAKDPRVGYATVYRTLKLLVDSGLAIPNRFGNDLIRYEPDIPGEHHDHLVCAACGAIIEFEDERIEALQEEVAALLGFFLSDHQMVLHGRPLPGSSHKCVPKSIP